MDPQSHCAAGLGVPEDRLERSIGEVLLDELDVAPNRSEFIWEVGRHLDLAPSTMALAGLEAPGGGLHALGDKDLRLARLLGLFRDRYDHCIIDCPPTIGLLTFNALRAAKEAIIPVETGYFALRGARKQWMTIQKIVERVQHTVACHVLPTLHNPNERVATDILAAIHKQFGSRVAPVVIHEHEDLRAAASCGQSVIEFSPDSAAAADFRCLADWLDETPEPTPLIEIEAKLPPPESRVVRSGPAPAMTSVESAPAAPPREDGSRVAELVRRVRELSSRQDRAQTNHEPAAVSTATAAQMAPATRPRFGVSQDDRCVRFIQPGAPGQMIAVAGDFNHWSSSATTLRYDEQLGAFQATLRLPPGRYEYRLIVDGRWQADPYNRVRAQNDFGIDNNVLIVE